MTHTHVTYLLVGGGVASSAAAEAIRARDPDGAVLLVGQEEGRPYHRPPLSKEYLTGRTTREALFAVDADWYVRNNVELMTGRRVERLDTARSAVQTDDGREITYDRLLLATGASPRKLDLPGADLPGLFYLRTTGDADRLRTTVDTALRGGRRRAVVVGAGRLGVELSATLAGLGLGVDLLTLRDFPLFKTVGEAAGRRLARRLEARGVTVRAGARAARLDGDGRVQRVVLADGTALPCDFAVAAVGVAPSKQVLRNTPVAAEKAILVDARCRTSAPHVYAAGDCAAVFDPRFGKHRYMDHWAAAVDTGRVGGTNMAGGDAAFDAVNRYTVRAFDLAIHVVGEPRLVDHRIVRGSTAVDSPGFTEIGLAADGRVAEVVIVGEPGDDAGTAEQLVRRRLQVNGNQERAKDPAVALGTLL